MYRNGKVVGQTKVAVRRIRVSFIPGRPVTFMVRVALRTGKVVPCAGRLTQAVKWQPPAAPLDLVAQPHDDSVTLVWQPSKLGDGTLNGYRVYRNGTAFRDVKTTTLTVALPPLRTYSMAVAACRHAGPGVRACPTWSRSAPATRRRPPRRRDCGGDLGE